MFDETKALRYRKRDVVLAFESDCPITYYKPWAGERGQTLPAGHMVMCRMEGWWKTGDVYGCAKEEFEQTYERDALFAPGENVFYRKKTTVLAYRPESEVLLRTVTGDLNLEIETKVGPDCYLVKNETKAGEVYPIPAEIFESIYIQVLPGL